MDPEIKKFFSERRERDLKTKTPEEVEEKFALEHWLSKAAKRAKERRLSSHPCTFSHPSGRLNKNGKTTSVIAEGKRVADGYCRSGNVDTEVGLDSLGNAAALDVQKFLCLKMKDGQTLLDHIEQETELSKSLLNIGTDTYESLRNGFLAIKQEDSPQITSSKIKQVYFPVDNSYHQLSILTSSVLIFEMKRRIEKMRFDDSTKTARELRKKNEYSETDYKEIFGLSIVAYGGTKPQNISTLNNQFGGRSYLLPSLPPSLQDQKVRLPRKDFFRDCLWPKNLEDSFTSMHKLLIADVNNLAIRQGRDNIVLYVFDRIVERIWQIRNEDTGWATRGRFRALPTYQKWILDNSYAEIREEKPEYITEFLEESARWIVFAYKKVLGKRALGMHDDEIQHFNNIVLSKREALL